MTMLRNMNLVHNSLEVLMSYGPHLLHITGIFSIFLFNKAYGLNWFHVGFSRIFHELLSATKSNIPALLIPQ